MWHTFLLPATVTSGTAGVRTTRALQEDEDDNKDEKHEGEHRGGDQDDELNIVHQTSLDPSDVRYAAITNDHYPRGLGLTRLHGWQRDSLALGGDARVHCHATLSCSNGRMNCHAIFC